MSDAPKTTPAPGSDGATDANGEFTEDREEARDLDRVTDLIEEPELNAGQMSNVMSIFEHDEKTNQAALLAREKELRSVKVDPSNILLLTEQMDVDKEFAEHVLREHNGDPVLALRSLVHRSLLP